MPRSHKRREKKPDASLLCPTKSDNEMIEMWLYGKSDNTQRAYRHDVDLLLDFVDKSLADVTLLDLQALDKSWSASGLSASSRNRRLVALRSLFRLACCVGYAPRDAGALLALPKVPNTLAERILSVEEVGRIFRVMSLRCRGISLPDGWYSAREIGEAMSISCGLVWKAALEKGWLSKTESHEVFGARRQTYVYAWETVRSWLAPVVLKPGWYSVSELAKAKHRSQSTVQQTARRKHWPYRVVNRAAKVYRMVKLFPSDCAMRMSALSRALRDYALIALLYYGGLRISEALSVRWQSFREAKDSGAFVTVFGKGGKTRTVRLPPQAWTTIKRIRGEAGPGAVVFWGQSPAGCLKREGTRQPLRRENAQRLLKSIAREAGVSDRLSPHWFRHTHATHALAGGSPIHLVQATLGHASLLSTECYLHVNPEHGSGEYLPDLVSLIAAGEAWLAQTRAPILPPMLAGQAAG